MSGSERSLSAATAALALGPAMGPLRALNDLAALEVEALALVDLVARPGSILTLALIALSASLFSILIGSLLTFELIALAVGLLCEAGGTRRARFSFLPCANHAPDDDRSDGSGGGADVVAMAAAGGTGRSDRSAPVYSISERSAPDILMGDGGTLPWYEGPRCVDG